MSKRPKSDAADPRKRHKAESSDAASEPPGKGAPLDLRFSFSTKEEARLSVEPHVTGLQLKRQLCGLNLRRTYFVDSLKLMYKGRLIADSTPLRDLEVASGSTVYVLCSAGSGHADNAADSSDSDDGDDEAEILPDDDDPEMIAAARANRKNKLAAERKLERETTEAKTANTDPRYATLQSAVLRLAVIGRKLEEGSLDFVATGAAAEIKLPELRASVETLSGGNKEAAEVGAAFLEALQGLLAAVNSNSTSAARPAFIATVATLKTWCATAGIEKQIVGL